MTKHIDFGNASTGIFIPLFIIAGLVIGYFLAWPQYRSLQENRAVLTTKQAEQSDREESLASINKLLADLQSKRDDLKAVDEALPDAPDIPGLLANLEYLAIQSGLRVNDIKINLQKSETDATVPAPSQGPKIMEIDIPVTGEYPQLTAFLLNLEHNLRIFDVQKVEFPNGEGKTRTFSIRLKTYYYQPPKL